MNNTKSKVFFDDDFEVTYEEEIPFSYGFDTKPAAEAVRDKTIIMETVVMDPVNYRTVPDKRQPVRESADAAYGNRRTDNYTDDYDYEDDYRNNYEDNYDRPTQRKRAKRKSSAGILSPVKKTAKYGTKAIYRVARSVVRIVSLLITAGTLGVLAYNFWRGAAPYGDPLRILTEKNYALAAYAAVAAIFLLFELIALFWSMTKMRIKEGRKVYREDTGRGLFSFIFIYLSSYLSFLLCSFLPDTLGSYAVLNGAKGALDVFGAMHNALLGLCLAGVISCLVRRHMN